MTARAGPPAFQILWRTFIEQFAANESATSDLQMRRAILGVFAFLITPGIYIMMSTLGSFEIVRLVARARNMPDLVETRLTQMAIIFVAYSMITTGLVTVFIWDTLVFDKRDAMVLGPLPIRGRTVVAAKLAALATFLLGTALAVNVTSGVPFGFITGGNDGHILQHIAGHLAGTIGGAVFIFSALVAVRGLLVLAVRPQFAETAGSMLQFVFLSAVLCFMMVPTAMGESTPAFLDAGAAEWMPMAWFFGLFELIRGSRHPGLDVLAYRAMVALPLSVAAAILVTCAGYRHQMRAALAPSANVAASARLRRWLAERLTGRDGAARGTAVFILTTLARSRPQQVPIAIAGSIAVAIMSVAVSTRTGGLDMLFRPRTVVLWMPMVVGYWIVVGLHASFAMPTQLPAAWLFRVQSAAQAMSYWIGIRAAMVASAVWPAILVNTFVVLPMVGWQVALPHTIVAGLWVTVAAQFASLLVGGIPFTRAYPPGHARLRITWPLYLLGMYVVAYLPVRWELTALHRPEWWALPIGSGILLVFALEIAGRLRARTGTIRTDDLGEVDFDAMTSLDLVGSG